MSYVETQGRGGGGSRFWREVRASYAFVERNFFLTKRYWGWEVAFLIFNVTSSLSVMYIGKAQGAGQEQLILYLGIGTVVWAYLRSVFGNISEMIVWERWEGTIEYTMMAPISRLTHMLGVALFAIIYGILRTALLLGALALFFEVDLSHANAWGALLIILVGSLSFVGIGIMAAVLPLLFTERGEEMTFIISSLLLLVSGVYYPISVLPGWMQAAARISPATYVLEGMRATILDGKPAGTLGHYLLPMAVIGLITIPLGMLVFTTVERYAKRTGRLKRSG
ncbi:MAG TPA: ABC transporter permease [Thermomicrobiaceae bacterium]|nr:ABC transporter permease [Thermomicrobiaceae bacterium]